MKEGNLDKVTNTYDVCFKCGKPDHFIRDCRVHKGEHNKCVMSGGDKNKSRDKVCDMSSRRGIVDHVVKKALAISSNSLSNLEGSEHP